MNLIKNYLTIGVAFLYYLNLYSAEKPKLGEYEERQDKAFQLIFSDPLEAKKSIDELLLESSNYHDTLVSSTYNVLGIFFAVKNQNDSALIAFNKAASLLPEGNKALPILYFNMAVLQKKIGNYEKSFELLNKLFNSAAERNDSVQLAKILGEKASVHRELEEYNQAVQNLLKSIEILKRLEKLPGKNTMIEKQKLANLYLEMGNYEFAEEMYLIVIPFFKENNLLDSYNITLINYADCLMNMGNLQQAEKMLKDAMDAISQFNNEDWNIYAYERYAKLQMLQYKTNLAFEFYTKAFNMAVGSQSSRTLQIATDFINFLMDNDQIMWVDTILNALKNEVYTQSTLSQQLNFLYAKASYYEYIEDYKSGYEYLKQARDLSESIQSISDYSEARELQAKYQNEIRVQENMILQQKITLQKRMYAIFILSLLFLLVVGIYSYNVLRLKNRNNQFQLKVAETNRQLSEQKLAAETILREMKEQDIENQRKELIDITMEKMELSNRLQAILEKIEDESENKNVRREIISIKKQYEYWEPLLNKFNEMNPDFQYKLKEKYPDLTRSELEFCTLVKLNLSFKEIASIMQISHSSVITKKYRLSKKLHLDSELDIYDFFKNLEC
jgi:tetratricopeptide (TPR) repeat protein